MPSLGQLTASSSQFVNRRGIYLGRRSTKFHVALYRRTGGRIGGNIPGWPEARIGLLEHVGAKSGAKRTSPVMYFEDGGAIVVMASKAGQPTQSRVVPQPQGESGDQDPDRPDGSRGTSADLGR